ncbi:MAG: hypothetical protein HDQ93_03655 [Desulfovibrio sp.]|nr:hypothetical protein [Desulfovibrio sp.]
MTEDFRKSGQEGRKRWLTSVSLSSLITLCFLAIVAMAMAYIGGVMSGRHLGGESRLPARSALEKVEPPSEESAKINEIIAAEDLEFARVLRGEPARKPEKAPKSEIEPAPKPGKESGAEEAPGKVDDAGANGAETKPAEAAESPVEKKEPRVMRDYVFQAGAFRDETSADNLRQKLEGYGLRTRLEKKNKFYIVLIMSRGDEERVREILDIARKLKLGEPILRSSEPATR